MSVIKIVRISLMNLHEYQSRNLLKDYSIAFPMGDIGQSPEEIYNIAKKYDGRVVVKAQIHSGGRGKAGGVKLCNSPEEAKEFAKNILGKNIITNQTDSDGVIVEKLLVTELTDIDREFYLSITIDPDFEGPVLIISPEGGMDIEKVAEDTPEKIIRLPFDPVIGAKPYELRKIIRTLDLPKEANNEFIKMINNLYLAFLATDSTLIEINPLVLDKKNNLIPLDCKINIDDDSFFRQKSIFELRDKNQENPIETRANKHGLSYIKLDGEIGCMVNGAGLAMATMDIIKLYGSNPANFLDVGGGASKEKVSEAFKIILSDKNVKGILVNIFGGIMRCDVLAQGIVDAIKEIKLSIPLVVRLAGTNVDLGKKILDKSGLKIISANNLSDAAKKIVSVIK